jgi:hypothetical protein
MTTTLVDPDEVLRRAQAVQEQQNAVLRTIIEARLATIAALEADDAAMKAGEEAGLTPAQLAKYGVPPLPAPEKPARRSRGPRGTASGAPRGRRARQGADAAHVAPGPAGNGGPDAAHVGATHGG